MAGGKRGPKIPVKTRGIINEAALLLPNIDREELAKFLRKYLADEGLMTPSLETVKRMISAARNSDTNEDQAWSLSTSAKYGIPDELNGDLFQILKGCLIIGRTLTIREAKWIARLKEVVPPENLLYHAVQYSIRERACLVSEIANDTADLDAELVFGKYDSKTSFFAAINTGIIEKPKHIIEKTQELIIISPENMFNTNNVSNADRIIESIVLKPVGLDFKHDDDLSEDGKTAYALWLRHLCKGTQWINLTIDRKRKIAMDLRKEIAATKNLPYWEHVDWEPSRKILKEVGLEPSDEVKGESR